MLWRIAHHGGKVDRGLVRGRPGRPGSQLVVRDLTGQEAVARAAAGDQHRRGRENGPASGHRFPAHHRVKETARIHPRLDLLVRASEVGPEHVVLEIIELDVELQTPARLEQLSRKRNGHSFRIGLIHGSRAFGSIPSSCNAAGGVCERGLNLNLNLNPNLNLHPKRPEQLGLRLRLRLRRKDRNALKMDRGNHWAKHQAPSTKRQRKTKPQSLSGWKELRADSGGLNRHRVIARQRSFGI